MANIFKGIESFLGKGVKASSEDIGGFISKTLKDAGKSIENLSSKDGLISKEIEAFQKDFREGIVNGIDDAGDLAKGFFKDNDYSEQIKKFSDMSDDITKLKDKVTNIGEKVNAGKLSEEELGKLKDQADVFQEQISKLENSQKTFLDNVTAGATKDYSSSLAKDMDQQINEGFKNYDEDFINELTRRNRQATKAINKNDIKIPSSMGAEDASKYSAAQDIFNSSNAGIKNLENVQGAEESINKFNTMKNNAEDLMSKLEQKAGYTNVANNIKNAGMSSDLADKMDGVIRHAVPLAVGGGLIFSMFNRGGNMSNSELYGQQQPYSGQ